jgi:hypothetical protein
LSFAYPPPSQERPEKNRAWQNQKAKTPRSLCGVGIDLANTDQEERNGKDKPNQQIDRAKDKKTRSEKSVKFVVSHVAKAVFDAA